jgi:hypothetical protein
MTVAQSASPASSAMTLTIKRLLALLEEDETDEYGILQPSQAAFKLAMRFVVEAYETMGDSFPKASASTDEEGSIRLTWSKPESDCEVRLICPAQIDKAPYLYHELGSTYAVEREVPDLTYWLEWFNQA